MSDKHRRSQIRVCVILVRVACGSNIRVCVVGTRILLKDFGPMWTNVDQCGFGKMWLQHSYSPLRHQPIIYSSLASLPCSGGDCLRIGEHQKSRTQTLVQSRHLRTYTGDNIHTYGATHVYVGTHNYPLRCHRAQVFLHSR